MHIGLSGKARYTLLIAFTLAFICLVALLPTLKFETQILIVGGVLGIGLFPVAFGLLLRHPLYGFWTMLFVLAMIPPSSVDPEVRIQGVGSSGTFSLFVRYFGGVLNVWDVLVLGLIGIVLFRAMSLNSRSIKIRLIGHWSVWFCFSLLGLALLHGLVNVTMFPYGPGTVRRWAQIGIPLFYFASTYLIVTNVVQTMEDWRRTARFALVFCAWAVALWGIYRLLGIFSGRIATIWIWGLPIVLYDQMAWMYYPINLLFARIWGKRAVSLPGVILALLGFVFILLSTRRFNYLLIVLNLFLVGWLLKGSVALPSWLHWLWRSRWVLIMGVALAVLASASAPQLVEGVTESIRSLNVFSYGYRFGGETRILEFRNLILNLDERPIAYLVGFGLGVPWKAFLPIQFGQFAYTESVLSSLTGWYPQFHLPYVSQIYRIGLLGALLLWIGVVFLTFRHKRTLGLAQGDDQPYLVALAATIPFAIATMGDSVNSYGYIVTGFALGMVEIYQYLQRGAVTAS